MGRSKKKMTTEKDGMNWRFLGGGLEVLLVLVWDIRVLVKSRMPKKKQTTYPNYRSVVRNIYLYNTKKTRKIDKRESH